MLESLHEHALTADAEQYLQQQRPQQPLWWNRRSNPSAFGFTDVSDPCFNGTTVCANPDQYLFWDDFHPTTATDSFVAKAFEAAVPEPATIVLLLAALALCFVVGKRLSPLR